MMLIIPLAMNGLLDKHAQFKQISVEIKKEAMDYDSFHKTILAKTSLFNPIQDGLSGDCSRMWW